MSLEIWIGYLNLVYKIEIWNFVMWKFDTSEFENSELETSEFGHSEFKNSEFEHSEFEHSEFQNSRFENLEFENSDLKIEIEHRQLLKYVCFLFVHIALFSRVKEVFSWEVFGPFWLPVDGFWV